MTVYMVFEPPRRDEDPLAHAERFVLVRDRFSWAAFLFAPLWMLRHRLWVALAIYVVLVVAVVAGLGALGSSDDARAFAIVLIHLLVGFEAASIRRRKLLRRGWGELGAVIGDDREAAERRFFDAYVASQAHRAAAPAAAGTWARPNAAPDVIGLFPERGAPG
jgi:hypothetical protein